MRLLQDLLVLLLPLALLLLAGGAGALAAARYDYEASWASLDTRPCPAWFDDAKLGVFIHWGVYSVPAYGTEWVWHRWKTDKDPGVVAFIEANYPPTWTYQAWAPQFTASLFDPAHWAELFEASGARYVVITSKHHEGYTLYPSKYSPNWNSDVGPRRDLLGELQAALRARDSGIRFGLYHSLMEFYHPLYLDDKAANFSTDAFVQGKVLPELHELVERFRPDVLWSDGDWEAPSSYWGSEEFLAWLFNDSPVRASVVTNDRWGAGCSCRHGGFFSCEDRFVPGELQPRKYESCQTLDRLSWGYRRDARLEDFLSLSEVLRLLASVVATGGNLLLNVGPDHLGTIHPIFEERLRQLGRWLGVNGEAIYGTRPWARAQTETDLNGTVWYTASADLDDDDDDGHGQEQQGQGQGRGGRVYALLLDWPVAAAPDARVLLHLASPVVPPGAGAAAAAARRGLRREGDDDDDDGDEEEGPTVSLLGYGNPRVPWEEAPGEGAAGGDSGSGIVLDLSGLNRDASIPKQEWAWAFVLEGFA